MKHSYSRIHRRRCAPVGFTLFELIASLAAASVLMVGLSSAPYVTVQSVDVANSPQVKVLEAQKILTGMHSDLHHATAITAQATDSVSVTIPDRDDADTLPDTVQYTWVGTGRELIRQYNGGAAIVVADSVHDLVFRYFESDGAVDYITIKLLLVDDENVRVVTSVPMVNRP